MKKMTTKNGSSTLQNPLWNMSVFPRPQDQRTSQLILLCLFQGRRATDTVEPLEKTSGRWNGVKVGTMEYPK